MDLWVGKLGAEKLNSQCVKKIKKQERFVLR